MVHRYPFGRIAESVISEGNVPSRRAFARLERLSTSRAPTPLALKAAFALSRCATTNSVSAPAGTLFTGRCLDLPLQVGARQPAGV
jgi:hypothetical protein